MNLFNKLPNSIRYPVGVEWKILKKIPWVLLIGVLLICAPILGIHLNNAEINAEQYRIIYICLGLLFTFIFFVGATAIGCVLIMVMKGPGYVADAYELPEEDPSLEEQPIERHH